MKLVGDWIDRAGGESADLAPLWTPEQLTKAFAAAHANGARVMVHTFAEETIGPLLAAGVDCIEHGTGMARAHMEQAAAAGIPVTPTLVQVENFPAIAAQADGKYPRYAAHMRRLHEERFRRVRDMYEAGVQLLSARTPAAGSRTVPITRRSVCSPGPASPRPRSSGRRPTMPAPTSECRESPKVPQPTSSSIPPTRGKTPRCSATRARSSGPARGCVEPVCAEPHFPPAIGVADVAPNQA